MVNATRRRGRRWVGSHEPISRIQSSRGGGSPSFRNARVNRDGRDIPAPGSNETFFLIPINHLKCHLARCNNSKSIGFARGSSPFPAPSCMGYAQDTRSSSSSLLFPLVPPRLGREIENTMARERMHEQRRALLVARVFNPGENTR